TMFLTPNAEPFWGGTYFPKTARFGRPGFIEILEQISYIFQNHPEKVEQNQAALVAQLKTRHKLRSPGHLQGDILEKAAQQIFEISDPDHGGLRGSPKFPQTAMYELLWRIGAESANKAYEKASLFALERISMGGIYDHIGGGYARYSVDHRWLVPHFEKMLYDNALLLNLMTQIWPQTGSDILRQRVGETISWLEREMLTADGGFASSLDADSEGVEGKFYVWTLDQIGQALKPDDAALFAEHYDITANGNWEGVSVPNRLHSSSPADPATEDKLTHIKNELLEVRGQRIRPGTDDKILCDWNGLAITAIARASLAFDRPDWLKLAEKVFGFVSESMSHDIFLFHSYRQGQTKNRGQLSDYANLIQAALALYERTLDPVYLERAETWTQTVIAHFKAPGEQFYMISDQERDLLIRPISAADDAVPNGNAIMLDNFARLGHLTWNPDHLDRAELLVSAFADDINANPLAHAAMLAAYHQSRNQVQISLKEAGDIRDYLSELPNHYLNNPIILVDAGTHNIPARNILLTDSGTDHAATAYICVGQACLPPATDLKSFRARLEEAEKIIANPVP
ncbi:MAG: thioredoxin domain-containing protein, partial [Fimbriimonadaceae bacterium]|nr:thioredoxin domain-containing protein [Alphaproteobacteria bacterium]